MTTPNNPASGVVSGPIILKFDDLDALAHALRGRESRGLVPWDRFCSEWPSDFADDFRLHARELIAKHGVSNLASDAGAVERELQRMREIATGWRRPGLAQVEGPNDLKIYGGTIADDIDRWAELLATAAADKAEIATLQARIAELEGAATDDELIERGLRMIRAYDAVRYLRDALSATTGRLSGYDWNADPEGLTKQQGDAFAAADKVFAELNAAVGAHPDIDLPQCETCGGTGKIEGPARTHGANQHSAYVRDCEDCDGCGFAADDEPENAPPAGGVALDLDEPLRWFLRMIEAAGGEVSSTDTPHNPINVFCGDRFGGLDTFNLSENEGFTFTSHDTSFDTAITRLTDKGREVLAALRSTDQEEAGK